MDRFAADFVSDGGEVANRGLRSSVKPYGRYAECVTLASARHMSSDRS